jgi:hypothetical protein
MESGYLALSLTEGPQSLRASLKSQIQSQARLLGGMLLEQR